MIKEFILITTISSFFPPSNKVSVWRLVFHEEFDGNKLNTDLWEIQTGCSEVYGAGNLQCYTESANNLNISNGVLTIVAKIEDYEDKQFTSGRLHTFGNGYLYGYFLIRARQPKGKLLWPALWLLTRSVDPPCYHEIDMMEAQGQLPNRMIFTAHYGSKFGNLTNHGAKNATNLNLSEEFHDYGLMWTKDSLGWYIDGKPYYEVSLARENWLIDGTEPCLAAPFSEPMNITLNMGVGGNLFSDNNLSPEEAAMIWTKPTFEIDWIRIYQKQGDVPSQALEADEIYDGEGGIKEIYINTIL